MDDECEADRRAQPSWCGRVVNLQSMRAGASMATPVGEILLSDLRIDADAVDGAHLVLFEEEARLAMKRDHDLALEHAEHGRSITVCDVPVNHLVGKRFRIGEAIVEGVALSDSQKQIERRSAKPVSGLLKHRAGLDVRIVHGGRVVVGASVEPL